MTVIEKLASTSGLNTLTSNQPTERGKSNAQHHSFGKSETVESTMPQSKSTESAAFGDWVLVELVSEKKKLHHFVGQVTVSDNQRPKLTHTKSVKRPAEEAVSNAPTECPTIEDNEKPPKLLRTEPVPDKSSSSDLQQQSQSSIPSFSVQIVQQFSKAPHSQHSQTIQTNVTVQALSKPSDSPLPQAQTVTVSQQVQESTVNQTDQSSVSAPILNISSSGNNVECKQEKDSSQSDLCQFKNTQDCHQQDLCDFKSNQTSNCGGDRLSDTFPSLGFTDESGDDVIHPDLLKDLIDDVFTNSADIMKDFNFDDSVGSMKDHEDSTKDIIDLMKGTSPSQLKAFQTDSTSVVNAPSNQNQQNGLFRSISSNNEATMSLMSTTTSNPVTTASSFFNTPSQRMAAFSNSSLSLPNGLGLDFKLTEPSPAALTLKQMAEQHQNMQQKQHHQQQLINSPLSNRPSPFNQDSYPNPMNNLRPVSYLNGTNNQVACNSPKTINATSNMFNNFDHQMNNFSAADSLNSFPGTEPLSSFPGTEPLNPFQNCEPISPNLFEQEIRSRNSVVIADADRAKQQRLHIDANCRPVEPPKPPAYGASRPLTHYSENVPVGHPAPSNQQQRIIGRQFQNNLDIRMQIQQSQHIHGAPNQQAVQQLQQGSKLPQNSNEFKQHPNLLPQHSNVFGNYTSQQPMNNPSFHVSVSQSQSMSYSTQFTTNQAVNRPPPDYKSHHTNMSPDNLRIADQLNAPSPMMYNNPPKTKYTKAQRAPNVTITPDGSAISSSGNWRHSLVNPQHHNQYRMRPAFLQQENYNVIRNEQQLSSAIPSPMFNQYRIPNNQVAANRGVRPNMMSADHMLMIQRQRPSAPLRLRNPSVDEMNHSLSMNNNPLAQAAVMNSVYSNPQDMNRQDGSQINLDFLDNIESSASDLLNFDQVMQGGETHFPLLEDIEMFNK
ncbi:uncharacterized protein LOC129216354 [Uloborus diversus]|uniref:uncharacterized protein LOC129216354 n=1 Tax=Uloborus diversus TaxID=327109 RepID=UPI002409734A|nr:uncharacterized protein LOC129216354 [Uloborus diversus]